MFHFSLLTTNLILLVMTKGEKSYLLCKNTNGCGLSRLIGIVNMFQNPNSPTASYLLPMAVAVPESQQPYCFLFASYGCGFLTILPKKITKPVRASAHNFNDNAIQLLLCTVAHKTSH